MHGVASAATITAAWLFLGLIVAVVLGRAFADASGPAAPAPRATELRTCMGDGEANAVASSLREASEAGAVTGVGTAAAQALRASETGDDQGTSHVRGDTL